MRNVDVLVFEWEYKSPESLTTIEKFWGILTNKEITRVKKDSLEYSHHVVDTQAVKKLLDSLIIHIW